MRVREEERGNRRGEERRGGVLVLQLIDSALFSVL